MPADFDGRIATAKRRMPSAPSESATSTVPTLSNPSKEGGFILSFFSFQFTHPHSGGGSTVGAAANPFAGFGFSGKSTSCSGIGKAWAYMLSWQHRVWPTLPFR
jgi:hypothetical protein